MGGTGTAPLMPGQAYRFIVAPTTDGRYFNIASMVVPSNDTFAGFGPGGVALLDLSGEARSDEAIAADIESMLQAWDAGAEANQAGAAGRDQAPRQAEPGTGVDEGSGLIRLAIEDSVWVYPAVADVLRVTVEPAH
jgi:hypothetical protein